MYQFILLVSLQYPISQGCYTESYLQKMLKVTRQQKASYLHVTVIIIFFMM